MGLWRVWLTLQASIAQQNRFLKESMTSASSALQNPLLLQLPRRSVLATSPQQKTATLMQQQQQQDYYYD